MKHRCSCRKKGTNKCANCHSRVCNRCLKRKRKYHNYGTGGHTVTFDYFCPYCGSKMRLLNIPIDDISFIYLLAFASLLYLIAKFTIL